MLSRNYQEVDRIIKNQGLKKEVHIQNRIQIRPPSPHFKAWLDIVLMVLRVQTKNIKITLADKIQIRLMMKI